EEAFADTARAARAVADEVVLYGPHAHVGSAALPDDRHVTAVTSIAEVARRIREETGPGDVVLVKGTTRTTTCTGSCSSSRTTYGAGTTTAGGASTASAAAG